MDCLRIELQFRACQRKSTFIHVAFYITLIIFQLCKNTHQPLMTPSTFSMGTILKRYLDRSSEASGATRKSSSPFIIQDALDSPGWTLEVKTTIFRCLIGTALSSLDVTVTRGMSWSLGVLARTSVRKRVSPFDDAVSSSCFRSV